MGTRNGDTYTWLSTKDCSDLAQKLSHGIIAYDLCPKVQAEGRDWKFMGIQAKNRKEWHLTGMAC